MSRPVTVGLNLTANTLTTVYTVPTGYYAKWNLMYVFNNTGSTKNFTAYWHDQSTGSDIYISDTGVSSKNNIKMGGGDYTVLEAGDKVMMQSEAGSSFSTICTFELVKKEGV